MKKENVIFVYRTPAHAIHSVSFDFIQAGRDIAGRIDARHQTIGIFTDCLTYSNANDFKEELMSVFSKRNDLAEFVIVDTAHSTEKQHAFDFFTGNRKMDVIVTTDLEKALSIKKAHFLGGRSNQPIIYSICSNALSVVDGIYCYHLNYQLLGKKLVNYLEDEAGNPQHATSVIQNKGFLFSHNPTPENIQMDRKVLNILTIPSPSTEALQKILPHFQRVTGIEVRLAIYSFEDIYYILTEIDNHQHYDIIRIDMAGLSWFAQKTLRPLNELNADMTELLADYPANILDHFAFVDGKAYAVPFDPSIQMLFYRKDVFEDIKNRRMFYELYKRELKIPETFEEFNVVAAFLSELEDQNGKHMHGTSITTGNSEIVASEFLLRYYAAGGKLVQADNSISLDKTIAKNALENYMETLNEAKNLNAKWWDESIAHRTYF
jgi:hypothetical protein